MIRFHLPGAGSIRGRYSYVAVFCALSLVGAALIGDRFVGLATKQSIENIRLRTDVADLTRELVQQVGDLETSVQRFLLLKEDGRRDAIAQVSAQIADGAASLAAHDWITGSAMRVRMSQDLAARVAELRADVSKLATVRSHVDEWMPVSRIMVTRMLPSNSEFQSLATLGYEAALALRKAPGQHSAARLFVDARYAWTLMVGEFRLLVSNRFGIFDDNSDAAMQARMANIEQYSSRVRASLDGLAKLRDAGLLEFEGEVSLEGMQTHAAKWREAYAEARRDLLSGKWRADLPILKNTVDPNFAGVRGALYRLQEELEAAAASDLNGLGATAQRLSQTLWLLALSGVALIALVMWGFSRGVLRPIGDVARALRDEARGNRAAVPAWSGTSEIRHLTEAFDDMRRQVSVRQQRLQNILDNAAEGIVTISEHGVVESFNRAAETLFGYQASEVIGENVSMLMPAPERDHHDSYLRRYLNTADSHIMGLERELQAMHKDGRIIPISLRVSEVEIDGRRIFTGLVADISERKTMMENLRHLAEHDGLTGLHNRMYFHDELARLIERARHGQAGPSALLYLDLDNFKYVNDTMGHAAGDGLLVEVAGLLNQRARRGDLIARFGGDEFVIILYETRGADALRVADAFRRQLVDTVFVQQAKRLDLACSIGITMIGSETLNADEALAEADFACHAAKRKGRNQVYMFDPADREKVTGLSSDMGWSRRIKEAIDHDRFALAAQPIVDLEHGGVAGHELLVRMRDDSGELVMPGGFLPAAERFGLSVDVDLWVVAHAVRRISELHDNGGKTFYCINLSAPTLSDSRAGTLIRAEIENAGLPPSRLVFEVTESVAITDVGAAHRFLSTVKSMGCRTALDDFGTGFTSFAYLRDLPLDIIKIDGRYVRHLDRSPMDQATVRALSEIVHAAGLVTIAECVEDAKALERLRSYGIRYAQGYHIGRPGDLTAGATADSSVRGAAI